MAGMEVFPRFRFSIRSLLWATALIAAGLTVFAMPRGREAILSTIGFAFIGAGVWTFFNRPWTGAVIGVLFPPTAIGVANAISWWLGPL
jgi:hypothetical protein